MVNENIVQLEGNCRGQRLDAFGCFSREATDVISTKDVAKLSRAVKLFGNVPVWVVPPCHAVLCQAIFGIAAERHDFCQFQYGFNVGLFECHVSSVINLLSQDSFLRRSIQASLYAVEWCVKTTRDLESQC